MRGRGSAVSVMAVAEAALLAVSTMALRTLNICSTSLG